MNFFITKKFVLKKIEKKGADNLYTLLDFNTNQKFEYMGTQTNIDHNLTEKDIVEVEINIKTISSLSILKSSKKVLLNVVTSYISCVKRVTVV